MLLKHDARANAADNTVRFHRDRAAQLLRLLGAKTLLEELPPTLNQYTDLRLADGASRHTAQKEQRVLRHMLKLAKKEGLFTGDPSAYAVEGFIEQRSYYKPGSVWLERVEYIEELIRQTSSNVDKHRIDRREDILVYVNLGLRRRELLVICPEHVDLPKRIVRVREFVGRRLKTKDAARDLPLNDVMCALFERRMRHARAGRPLFTDWGSGNRDLRANWSRARAVLIERAETPGERADLEATLPRSLTFNDLRRTFCSQMKNAGVSLEDCADLLGHADVAMVKQVYGRTSMTTLRAAVAALPSMALPAVSEHVPRGPSRRERQRARKAARAGRAAAVFATNATRKEGSDSTT